MEGPRESRSVQGDTAGKMAVVRESWGHGRMDDAGIVKDQEAASQRT